MKFFYGIENNYIDVTFEVLENCLSENIISIPLSDTERSAIFGDHLFGIVKNIKVIFDDNTVKIFKSNQIAIFEIINNNLLEIYNMLVEINIRTLWWNKIGKYIKDSNEKLRNLHKYLRINHGNIADEYPEQLMVINYINENDIVLELGSNIGRNSCIIAQILNKNDKNLVTLECDLNHVKQLTENRNNNNFNFQIEPSALSKKMLIQKGWETIVSDILLPEYTKVNIIDWSELKNKYNLNFNTLVADCEGALYYILQDEPDMLANFDKIILENDYHDINHKIYVDNIMINNGFKNVYKEAGGWGPCFDFFFEVWQK